MQEQEHPVATNLTGTEYTIGDDSKKNRNTSRRKRYAGLARKGSKKSRGVRVPTLSHGRPVPRWYRRNGIEELDFSHGAGTGTGTETGGQ